MLVTRGMEKAVILSDGKDHSAAVRLERILTFFGIPCRMMTTAELIADDRLCDEHMELRLLSSAADFLGLIHLKTVRMDGGFFDRARIHSIFIVSAESVASLEGLMDSLCSGCKARVVDVEQGEPLRIADRMSDFRSVMGGLDVTSEIKGAKSIEFDANCHHRRDIIFSGRRACFFQLDTDALRFFISTNGIIDTDAVLDASRFDVRTHFLSAVPVVLYIRFAFARTAWQPAQTSACVVIDDPPLRPRYGFLDFERLLAQMQCADFTTSIAFIPYNWRRCAPTTVQMFRDYPSRYSLSVHGCDHTHGEFGCREASRLEMKSRTSLQRMARLQDRTGLTYDRVMVFPQGVFSAEAMRVLKREDFIAAVNTEVICKNQKGPDVRVRDYWDVAVMRYSQFALFTRRYPKDGVVNFAFDILLGKPCLIVIHHADCKDDCRELLLLIRELNRLGTHLVWTNLGKLVRRSFRQKEEREGTVHVELCAKEIRLENTRSHPVRYLCHKLESQMEMIHRIYADDVPLEWTAKDGAIHFSMDLDPGSSVSIAIKYFNSAGRSWSIRSVAATIPASFRRYLTEMRDNLMPYIS
jgi:hypothetical protein